MRLFLQETVLCCPFDPLGPGGPPVAMPGGLMALRQMDDTNRRVWASSARHAVNPSVGVRRQLPLHKGAVFAFLHRTCLARERSMPVAARHSA